MYFICLKQMTGEDDGLARDLQLTPENSDTEENAQYDPNIVGKWFYCSHFSLS